MGEVGKLLIVVGLVLAAAGLMVYLAAKTPLGRLPGDILIQRRNFTLALPIVTCILISVGLTLVLWIVARLRH